MDLNTYLQTIFTDLAQKVPGFISVAIVTSNGVIASYPSQMRKELELVGPFHLQIHKQAMDSINESSEEEDMVKEILITTEKRLYVLESRTQKGVGVLTLDINKANLGLARIFSEKVAEEIYKFLKDESLLDTYM